MAVIFLTIDGLPQTGKIRLTITDLTGAMQSRVEFNNSSKDYTWDISKIKKRKLYSLYKL